MITDCNIIKKTKSGEYLSCLDCKHCYFEELDDYTPECELPLHWLYNWEYEEDEDENGDIIQKICIDFEEQLYNLT